MGRVKGGPIQPAIPFNISTCQLGVNEISHAQEDYSKSMIELVSTGICSNSAGIIYPKVRSKWDWTLIRNSHTNVTGSLISWIVSE